MTDTFSFQGGPFHMQMHEIRTPVGNGLPLPYPWLLNGGSISHGGPFAMQQYNMPDLVLAVVY